MEALVTMSPQMEKLNETHQSISTFAADDIAQQLKQDNSATQYLTSSIADPGHDAHNTSALASSLPTSSSTITASAAPKVSMSAKTRLNFVIPKNKLSGALVPVTKSSRKWETLDSSKDELKQPTRKSKWGPDLTQDPFVKRGRALALQTRAEQLAAQMESGNLDVDSNELTRSPSPPPVYDILGHRINTREGRKREQLDFERREAIGECIKLNPSYKPPPGYKPVLKEAKLFIPAKDHPGYNFIGLILGPRGNTQKRMESETGAKITIRGKGAIKDGKLSARNGIDIDGSSEALHVHITADTFEKVDAAVAIIEPLLIPVDEDRNMHKMKQLRELAEMNGTVRDLTRVCSVCGDMGHRDWQCPRDHLQSFQVKVICQRCGDGGHPTSDCSLKSTMEGKQMDREYLSFLEELGAGLGGIDPSENGSDNSQPMLLTASGAQPMPERWTGSGSGSESTSGANNTNDGQPKLPFPIPPGPDGMNAISFLLPRLLYPVHGAFNGRPLPPPSLPMMSRMLSAFRGRLPFLPFGPGCDIRIPSPATAADGSSSGSSVMENQSQTTTIKANLTGNLSSVKDNQDMPASSMPVPVSVRPGIPSVRPAFTSVWPAVQQGQMPPVNNNPSQPWSGASNQHPQSSVPLHIPPQPFPMVNSPGLRPWGNTQGPGSISAAQYPAIPALIQPFASNMITSQVPARFPPVQVSQGQFAMTQNSVNYNPHSGFPCGPSPPMPTPFPSFGSQHASASQQRFSCPPQGMLSHGPTFSSPDFSYMKSQFQVSAGSQRPFPAPNTQVSFRGPSSFSPAQGNPNQDNHHNFGPLQGHTMDGPHGSVGIFPRQQLRNTFTPQGQDTDPEYEKLMASVGVI